MDSFSANINWHNYVVFFKLIYTHTSSYLLTVFPSNFVLSLPLFNLLCPLSLLSDQEMKGTLYNSFWKSVIHLWNTNFSMHHWNFFCCDYIKSYIAVQREVLQWRAELMNGEEGLSYGRVQNPLLFLCPQWRQTKGDNGVDSCKAATNNLQKLRERRPLLPAMIFNPHCRYSEEYPLLWRYTENFSKGDKLLNSLL